MKIDLFIVFVTFSYNFTII